jgi:CRP/FNR family transcriptional regulator, nitrogen oxide reductase regulator
MNNVAFSLAEKSGLLRGLDSEALAAVKQAAIVRHVEKNAKLLKQGDAPDHLFVVIEGRFKMTTLNRQRVQKILRFMEVGDAIGCAAVFRNFPYPASATATTNSTALSWNASHFNQLVRLYPQLATNALAMMGDRAKELVERVHEVTRGSVEQRIARAILKLKMQAATEEDSLPVSGQDLAELSDTTPFTVSRTISAWKRAGIVSGGRGRMVILNPKRLSEISASEHGAQD